MKLLKELHSRLKDNRRAIERGIPEYRIATSGPGSPSPKDPKPCNLTLYLGYKYIDFEDYTGDDYGILKDFEELFGVVGNGSKHLKDYGDYLKSLE